MNKINQEQIRNSFFNPVYSLLPLLAFRMTDLLFRDVCSLWAWAASLAVGIFMLLSVAFVFRKLLYWYAFNVGLFFISYLLASVFPHHLLPEALAFVFDDVLCLLLFTCLLFFRQSYTRVSICLVCRKQPMSNNISEMRRVLLALSLLFLALLIFYVFSLLLLPVESVFELYSWTYVLSIGFFVLYQTLRVFLVRKKLSEEKWWPVVSEQGKVLGSIEHYESLFGKERLLHPVIRVLVLENSRLYLRKIKDKSFVSPGLWDTALSSHVQMNETVDEAVRRVFAAAGKINPDYFFLSSYLIDSELERRYAYLFITCNTEAWVSSTAFSEATKWWTLPQIEDNRDTGIFTPDFLAEYEIVKRAGFFDLDACPCECKLKRAINLQFEK